jgi:hypothetical protein
MEVLKEGHVKRTKEIKKTNLDVFSETQTMSVDALNSMMKIYTVFTLL